MTNDDWKAARTFALWFAASAGLGSWALGGDSRAILTNALVATIPVAIVVAIAMLKGDS
jgi:hypothetical protein